MIFCHPPYSFLSLSPSLPPPPPSPFPFHSSPPLTFLLMSVAMRKVALKSTLTFRQGWGSLGATPNVIFCHSPYSFFLLSPSPPPPPLSFLSTPHLPLDVRGHEEAGAEVTFDLQAGLGVIGLCSQGDPLPPTLFLFLLSPPPPPSFPSIPLHHSPSS